MYKLENGPMGEKNFVIVKVEEGWTHCIPKDPDNTDYQAYLRWIAEGNEPLPADEPQA